MSVFPPDIRTEFRGEAREAEQNRRTQPLLFLAATIAVYIILGMLYESYAHPFTILSTLPSATFGAMLALTGDGDPVHAHHGDRLHSAGRHRHEERHHDGRLRPRCRTALWACRRMKRSAARPVCDFARSS